MDDPQEASKTPEQEAIQRLNRELVLCRGELQAQNMLIKALIATHLGPDIVRDAFVRFSEQSVSQALGSPIADGSIEAFERFRDYWLEWLQPHAEEGLRRSQGG